MLIFNVFGLLGLSEDYVTNLCLLVGRMFVIDIVGKKLLVGMVF